jgi:hypothetical protein
LKYAAKTHKELTLASLHKHERGLNNAQTLRLIVPMSYLHANGNDLK